MKRSAQLYLQDIVDCIDAVGSFTFGITKEEFLKSDEKQSAVFRKLEIIGEAAKNIGGGLKKEHPEIPWPEIGGLRNRLIHEYFGINPNKVWQTIKNDLPKLKFQIQKIIKQQKL
jgi:uncharacterized protein with HEPN domain